MNVESPRPRSSERSRDLAIWFVLTWLFALAVRLGVYHFGLAFRYPDESDYWGIAKSLAAGAGFRAPADSPWPTIFRAPLLPYLLSFALRLGLHEGGVRFLLAATTSLLAPASMGLSLAIGGSLRAALFVAAIAALHPVHARAAMLATTDSLAATLVAIAVTYYCLLIGRPMRMTASRALSLGLLLGVCLCLRTNLIFLSVPIALTEATRSSLSEWKSTLRVLTLMGLGAALVVAPVVALRSAQEGRVVLITDAGSQLAWLGNSSHTTDYLSGTRLFLPDYLELVNNAPGTPVAEQMTWRAIRGFVSEDPPRWIWLKLRMLLMTWPLTPSFAEDSGLASLSPSARRAVAILKTCWSGGMFASVFIILASTWRHWRVPTRRCLLALIILATCFGTIYYPDTRYRLSYDIFVVSLIVLEVSQMRSLIRRNG